MLQRPVAYSPPRGEKLRCLSSDRFKRHYTITLPSHSALSMVKLKASQSNCKINSPSCSPSHVQKRCDKAWRNISNLLNPWRWLTSSGRTRPSSSSSPNVLSTCKPSAVHFFAVTCAKSYSLLFNPAEVGGEFHVYTLNAGSESWIRVGWIMRSYSKLLRLWIKNCCCICYHYPSLGTQNEKHVTIYFSFTVSFRTFQIFSIPSSAYSPSRSPENFEVINPVHVFTDC